MQDIIESLVKVFPQPMFILNKAYNIVYYSDVAKELIDPEKDKELINLYFPDFISHWYAAQIKGFLSNLKPGRISNSGEVVIKISEDERKPIAIQATIPQISFLADKIILTLQDISSYKSIEADLRESQYEFQRLISTLPSFIWTNRFYQNGQTVYNFISKSVKRVTGYSYDRFETIRQWLDVIFPEDLTMVNNYYNQIRSGYIENLDIEFRFFRPNQTIGWLNFKADVEYLNEGFLQIMAVITDVTEKKVMQEKLRLSEERYRLISENTNDVIFSLDFDLNFLYISPSVTKLLGHDPVELTGQPFKNIIVEDTQKYILKRLQNLANDAKILNDESKLENINSQIEVITQDGQTIQMKTKIQPMLNDEKKIIGFRGMMADISRHKKIEHILLENQKYTGLIEAQSREYQFIIDDSGKIIHAEKDNILQLFLNKHSVLGENLIEIFKEHFPVNSDRKIVLAFLDDNIVSFREEVGDAHYHTTIHPLPSAHSQKPDTAVVTIKDITQKVNAEKASIENLSMLQLLLWI